MKVIEHNGDGNNYPNKFLYHRSQDFIGDFLLRIRRSG